MKKTISTDVRHRQTELAKRRNLKMARSAQEYVRGNTARFYEWLESGHAVNIPKGPAVWICGDCHSGNLGPIANAKGKVVIQVRDLDQTVIGNPAHDLIRLGLSLASAARGSDLPGVTTARMLEEMLDGYALAFARLEDEALESIASPDAVKIAMKMARRRSWGDLARERIEGTAPTIPLGKRFWPLSRTERKEVAGLFATERVRRLVTSLRSRDSDSAVKVLDAAFWVKGCSSLGRLRYAVLLEIGGDKGDLCLMDVKEAVKAVAPRSQKAATPKDNAERVVKGAWHLSPALGDRMLASPLGEHSVFLRELLPQDLKFDIGRLTAKEAIKVAAFLATVVGKAHARQMEDADRCSWLKELKRSRAGSSNAAPWLWSSVIQLLVSHEEAYLQHCRKYAFANGECTTRR